MGRAAVFGVWGARGAFLAILGFALLGFMFSNISGHANWGVGVGVFGLVCYGLGYVFGYQAGWHTGRER